MIAQDSGPSLLQTDPRYRNTLIQMMRSHAYRELSAAQLFGHALQYVPDIESLKLITEHIQEETEHYIAVAELYRKHIGESLEPWVNERLASKPVPMVASFLELGMAQWLYDRGGFWQFREYTESSWMPYRVIVGKILKQEEGHQHHGEEIAVPLCRQEKNRDLVQRLFEKWLRMGLLCLGRPYSEGSKYAISMGLKKRDSAECLKDYVRDILPAVRKAGVRLPPRESLGVELPPDIHWPLD